ncbi:hypothetical protein N2W54_002962 [Lotmaria passim]
MDPAALSPAPVLSPTVEVLHVSAGPPAPPPATAPAATVNASTLAAPQLPDAFAVTDASADPLLAGLQLAQERLAYHLSQSASTSFYHSGAVTSLFVPGETLTPLPQDVVDAAVAATARTAIVDGGGVGGTNTPVAAAAPLEDRVETGKHRKKKPHGKDRKERGAQSRAQRRHMSRREREYARRVDAALSPALVVEMQERLPPALSQRSSSTEPRDVIVLNSSSSSSNGSSSSTWESSSASSDGEPGKSSVQAPRKAQGRSHTTRTAAASTAGAQSAPSSKNNDKRRSRKGSARNGLENVKDDDNDDRQQRRRRRQQQQKEQQREAEAYREPSTSNLDAHLRDLRLSGSGAAATAQTEPPASRDEVHGDRDYRPDDDDAPAFVQERMRLLQQEGVCVDGAEHVGSDAPLRGYAALVRPAEHFQRGPIPAWVRHYSNWLLFDAHRLDHHDAAALKKMQQADQKSLPGHSSSSGGLHVQLPVDAVVLRLRGDIARARRLRDDVMRGGALYQFFFPDRHVGRHEVYSPAEMNWAGPAAAGALSKNGDIVCSANNDEVEMCAAVPASINNAATPQTPANNNVDSNAGGLPEDSTVVVVTASEGADSPDRAAAAHEQRQEKSRKTEPLPSSRPGPLLLSRDVEARDLQRSLLAQTIPAWRRRGAAVKFLSELIDLLEGRLHAFGKQLDDPVTGPALELIGAPDSSGVDGTVRSTLPPALERALRTTVTNTLLSDIFATSRSALGSRALRLSEALRRRQTPYVHDVYVTQLSRRPVYDYTKLCTTRSLLHAYALTSMGMEGYSQGHRSGGGGASGVDTRKSYSIHVDYVRFQPSLESSALRMLRSGAGAAVTGAGGGGGGGPSPRRPTLLSSSGVSFSSALLGSYASVFFPKERAGGALSSSPRHHAEAAESSPDVGRRGALGTDNVDGTTAALLLALSAATSQSSLVSFTPEDYLISLLLRYYEQYRMLQLNLLPTLKNRFFYQEQLAQLQRQPRRNTDLNQLQARLETLAETSAKVERGCLHVMILLWNSVLEQRRRERRQRQLQRSRAAAQGPGRANLFSTSNMPNQGSNFFVPSNAGVVEAEEEDVDDDRPIIVGHRAAATVRSGRERRHHHHHRSSSGSNSNSNNSQAPLPQHLRQSTAVPPPPTISEELRAHPPVFPDEPQPFLQQQQHAGYTPRPVVHSVNNTVTCNEADEQQQDSNGAASCTTAAPLALFSSPNSPGPRAASATASPLLAPPSAVSSSSSYNNDTGNGSSSSRRRVTNLSHAGENGTDPLTYTPPAATKFRFFLRRYGTMEEVPYTMGDDLLWYAAEVEGTDVLPTVAHTGPTASAATMQTAADELLYFQLVVFARSHAAMAPQYVGCTTPRPMTTSRVVFFNETFEVRALHEPAELLLHLIPVTAGPSKMSVVSTVRLKPTLTRRYTLLPLQPPTAFMFHGKLFTRNNNSSAGVASSASGGNTSRTSMFAAAPLSGVLAVSTTWTSSQGLTVAQMERIFLRSGGGSGTGADPLDPQYLPLLRSLRSYYLEQESARRRIAASASNEADSREKNGSGQAGSRRRRARHRAAVQDALHRQQDQKGALLTGTSPGASAGYSHVYTNSSSGDSQRSWLGHNALGVPTHTTPMMVQGAAAGAHDYAVEEVQRRLPTARLQYLFRRWLIKIGRIKAADEVESRLLAQPIPLDDADTYLARNRVLREVEQEDEHRQQEYRASGVQFDAERYYKAPSAISGLALSNLPRETKLKLWQERQRRMVLTLKANRHVTDAEKLETIVTVPKLQPMLMFDLTPRSQLNPHRKVRPKNEDIDRALLKRRQDSHIVIHLMKVHNLPNRTDGTPLEPFVQVSFVSEAAYTRSEAGSSPSWFQTLELPFQPLDFEEDTLSMIDDDIVVSLYDKVEVKMAPVAATTAAVAHETHYRTERRFLGTLRIPFYSLHQAPEARMEGVYPLRTPRWLLGYDLLTAAAEDVSMPHCFHVAGEGTTKDNPLGTVSYVNGVLQVAGSTPAVATTAISTDDNVYSGGRVTVEQQASEPTVQLYMSLWPPLQRDPPKELSESELHRRVNALYVAPQLHYLHRVALQWRQTAQRRAKSIAALSAQAKTRNIEPFVECSTGDLVLVCRYMLPRGGPPPPSVCTVYEAIRYVSLLPFVADMMSFGEKDVWSTNVELLAMRSGDYEELALLLAHFLRYLAPGRPTFVVVGSGNIYRQTIMVLHEFEDKRLYLIDPRSGWTVPAEKPYGTLLRDVYMVVSHDQIWANTQMSGLPHRMTWDLHNPAHWLPCFDSAKDRRIPACLPYLFPIQREVLDFPPADAVKSREIELELRACLRRALLMWRNGCPPAYHRGVEAILHELLEQAEQERCTCGSARRTDLTRSAAARLSEYFGEPVTGELMMSSAGGGGEDEGRQAIKKKKRRRRATSSRSRHRSHQREATELGKRSDAHTSSDDDDDDRGGHGGASPSSSAAALRVLGAPVMGSYNPADPQFEGLLQQVFEVAVHEVGTSEVSFAAGIYVKSYTGDVCAMWVFLVAICRA